MDLTVMRKQTRRFIAERPLTVTLRRSVLSKTSSGGFQTEEHDLPPQVMRLIPQETSPGVARETVSGEGVSPDFVLLAEQGADMRTSDEFYLDGMQYLVVYVRSPRNGYETWGEVSYRG